MPVIRIPEEIIKTILSNIPEDEQPTDEQAINLLMGCVLSLQEEVDDVKEALRGLTNIMRTMNIMVAMVAGKDITNGTNDKTSPYASTGSRTKLDFPKKPNEPLRYCRCAECTQQRLDDVKNAEATKDRAESPE